MSTTSAILRELPLVTLAQGVNTEAFPNRLEQGEMLKTSNMIGRRNHLKQVDGYSRRGSNIGFTLDGSNDYFTITHGNQTNLHQTGSVTVSAIIKTHSAFSGDDTIVARWTGTTGTSQYRLRLENTGDVVFEVSDGSSAETVQTDTALSISTVYVISGSWSAANGSKIQVWSSAGTRLQVKTASTSLSALNSSTTPSTTIGAEHGGSDFFTGQIAYVMYKDAEVTATTLPTFLLDDDVQGLWRGALDATPKLIDYSYPSNTQNANHMTPTSVTTANYSSACGSVVAQLIGEPQHIDNYGVTSSPTIIVTTSLRTYQWDADLVSWVDHGGLTHLAGDTSQKAQGDNFNEGTDGSIYVITNHADQPKVRKTATDELGNLSSSLSTLTARIFRGFGTYGNLYNTSVTSGGTTTNYPARHQWSSADQVGNGDWDIGGTGDWTDLVDTPGQIMQVQLMGAQMMIYKERGAIIAQTLSGRAAPTWRYQTLYAGESGIVAANTLKNIGGRRQMFLGVGDIMIFDGRDITGTSEKVFNQITDLIKQDSINKSWAFYDEPRREYQLWFPSVNNTNPATYWVYNIPKKAWYGPVSPSTTEGEYVLGGFSPETDTLLWDDVSDSWDSQSIVWDQSQVAAQTRYVFTANGMAYKVADGGSSFDAGAIDTRVDFPELQLPEKMEPGTQQQMTARVFTRWEEVEIEASVGGSATLTLYYSTNEGGSYTSLGSPVATTYDGTIRRYAWYPDFVADKVRWRLDKTGSGTSITIGQARFVGLPLERR